MELAKDLSFWVPFRKWLKLLSLTKSVEFVEVFLLKLVPLRDVYVLEEYEPLREVSGFKVQDRVWWLVSAH